VEAARAKTGYLLLIALLALVAASKAILYDTLDPDCFWHLRVAEQLQRDGIGPIVDDISFASIKTPWTPYSWLAEMGMKLIWDAGGYRAAVLTQALLMVAYVVLVALCAYEPASNSPGPVAGSASADGLSRASSTKKRSAEADPTPRGLVSSLNVAIAAAFGMYFALPYLSFRPVTVAIVLLTLCAWLLLRDRRFGERTRAVWLVVPVTVVITNCHFFAILVPVFVGALFAGAIWERRRVNRYGWLLALTILACAATPMLPGAIRAVLHYQLADPMVGGGVVAEFRPFWSGALGAVSVALVLVWVALLVRDRHEIRMGDWIWAIGSLVLFIRLGRFAPVFAPIAAATLAARLPMRLGERALGRNSVQVLIGCVIALGIVRLVGAFPGADTPMSDWINRHGPETPGYPTGAAAFVETNLTPASRRLINEFTWGGYLAWRLGDRYQVLLDGRTQLYTPQFWRSTYLSAPDEAREILRESGADVAILPIERSRFKRPLSELGWRVAFRDARAEVLVPADVAMGRIE
jgi:hypothetical protein